MIDALTEHIQDFFDLNENEIPDELFDPINLSIKSSAYEWGEFIDDYGDKRKPFWVRCFLYEKNTKYCLICKNNQTGAEEVFSNDDSTYEAKEVLELKKQIRDNDEKRKRIIANKAKIFYKMCQPIANISKHPYLMKKKVDKVPEDLREKSGNLIIPMYSERLGEVYSYQTITPEGKKLFPKESTTQSLWYMFGELNSKTAYFSPVYICEGWATAYAIYKITGKPTFCIFSASNFSKGSQKIQEVFGTYNFIICADNDETGIKNAEATEKYLLNSVVKYPEKEKEDFWDMWQRDFKLAKAILMYDENDFTVVTPLGFKKNNFYYYTSRANAVFDTSHSHSSDFLSTLANENFFRIKFPNQKGDKMDKKKVVSFLKENCLKAGNYSGENLRESGFFLNKEGDIYLWNGKRIFGKKNPDYIHINSKLFDVKIGDRGSVDKEKVISDFTNLVNIVRKFSFANQNTSAEIICSWALLAPFCGAIHWRPHIYLTGRSSSGKSWTVDNIFCRLLNNKYYNPKGNSSEAGVRGLINSNYVPLIFDEFEKSENERKNMEYQNILDFIKLSSDDTGGAVVKSSSTHELHTFAGKTMASLSSIQLFLKKEEDFNRFLIIPFGEKSLNLGFFNKEIKNKIKSMPLEKIGDNFINYIFYNFKDYERYSEEDSEKFSYLCEKNLGKSNNHLSRSLGSLSGIMRLFGFEFEEYGNRWFKENMSYRSVEGTPEDCYNYLITSIVELHKERRTFAAFAEELYELERRGNLPEELRTYKRELGIFFKGDDLYISRSHRVIKNIFKSHPLWKGSDWVEILLKYKTRTKDGEIINKVVRCDKPIYFSQKHSARAVILKDFGKGI